MFFISISYFVYLSIKLYTNDILPKVVELTTVNDGINTFEYDYSPVSFNLLVNNYPIDDFSLLKNYFDVYVSVYDSKNGKV